LNGSAFASSAARTAGAERHRARGPRRRDCDRRRRAAADAQGILRGSSPSCRSGGSTVTASPARQRWTTADAITSAGKF
jgi:hypothetical protein